jgi:hypothetical protein
VRDASGGLVVLGRRVRVAGSYWRIDILRLSGALLVRASAEQK